MMGFISFRPFKISNLDVGFEEVPSQPRERVNVTATVSAQIENQRLEVSALPIMIADVRFRDSRTTAFSI